MKHVRPVVARQRSVIWILLGVLAEIMLTAAAVCALYIAWQMWWTGVQSEHTQIETRQAVSWSDPGKAENVTIAQAQEGDPPVQPQNAQEGELIAQVYIPRFGSQWQRNLVEGTTLTELNKHGLGHYTNSQMPGQIGNFAFAGHRNGYGQPLGDVDKLQEGDPIIIRTQTELARITAAANGTARIVLIEAPTDAAPAADQLQRGHILARYGVLVCTGDQRGCGAVAAQDTEAAMPAHAPESSSDSAETKSTPAQPNPAAPEGAQRRTRYLAH